MPRTRDWKCCYSRWSEPLLQRPYSTHFKLPISDGESSSAVRKSGSSSPFLRNIKIPTPNSIEPETSACCGCGTHCRRKKPFKIRASSRAADDFSKKSSCDRYRDFYKRKQESLEIELVGNEIEESIADEKIAGLIKNLEILNEALEAILIHVKSLEISHSSAKRVLRSANELLLQQKRSSSSTSYSSSSSSSYSSALPVDLEAGLSQAESSGEKKVQILVEIGESLSKNLNLSEELNTLIEENRLKRKDFKVAAKNFHKLLEDCKLSVSQMDKLQRQYEMIIDDYRENRRVLERELPKIVKTRLAAIRNAFKTMAEFYDYTENSKQISDLLKIFSENIFRDDGVMDKRNVKSDICQKCKVNRVPVVVDKK